MRKTLFIFLGSLVLLLLTIPANHLEAEDAYFYARMAEEGSGIELFHPHHLLYLPFVRTAFRCAQAVGYSGRAFPLLIALSALAGAAAVTIFARLLAKPADRAAPPHPPTAPVAVAPALCRRRFEFLRSQPLSSATPRDVYFALALLFSYGFWRYSVTAEIYLPALALMMGALLSAVHLQRMSGLFWSGVGLSAAAGLTHLISLPLVLAAIPALYILRHQRRLAIIHALAVAGLIAAAYGAVAAGPGWRGYIDPAVAREGWAQPVTWIKAVAAAGHTLLSGNFLFAWPAAGDALQRMFPSRMLQEEIFMGQQAVAWVRWFAPVTFAAPVGVLSAVWLRILVRLRVTRSEPDALCAGALVWLVGTAALALWTEPANPEMWIAVTAPFWILTACLWPTPQPESRMARIAPGLLAVLMLAHNGIGGMAMVASPSSDYSRAKFAWIEARAGKDDLVLTAESHSVITRLQYTLSSRVEDAKFLQPEDWPKIRATVRGRVYVMGDVLTPAPAVLRRDPASVERLRVLADQIRPGLTLLHENEWGGVYEFEPAR